MSTDLQKLADEIKGLAFRAKLTLAGELYEKGRYEIAESVVRMAHEQLQLENALRRTAPRQP